MKLAVSGKGGVGKTCIAAGLALAFSRRGRTVYAVDADPDSNLGWALGFPSEELSSLTPISEMKDEMRRRVGAGPFMVLDPEVEDLLEEHALERERIRLVRMGRVKESGSACYCPENTLLRAVVRALLLSEKELVIMDMAAGIEHLTRGTSGDVGLMLVVVEPTRTSMETARTVFDLATDLGIRETCAIANKVRSEAEEEAIREDFGERVLFVLPYDEELPRASLAGRDGFEYPPSFLSRMEQLADVLEDSSVEIR